MNANTTNVLSSLLALAENEDGTRNEWAVDWLVSATRLLSKGDASPELLAALQRHQQLIGEDADARRHVAEADRRLRASEKAVDALLWGGVCSGGAS